MAYIANCIQLEANLHGYNKLVKVHNDGILLRPVLLVTK